MGDPRKIRNKYEKPMHPWEKTRIEEEKKLMQKYGLVNKKELWKITSKLTKFKDNAKKLVAKRGTQAEKETSQLISKVKSLGLIQTDSVEEILGITAEQLFDRRLQTIVQKKGLARTAKQARQMITHRHILIGNKKMTAPGYLVKLSEEHTITFYPGSSFSDENHPERKKPEEQLKQEIKKVAEETNPTNEELGEEQ